MVKCYISFIEMKSFIDDVVNLCEIDKGYQPFMKEFAIDYCVLKYYTDYPVGEKSFEEIYSDIYNDNEARDDITAVKMNSVQLKDITKAVKETIDIKLKKKAKQSNLTRFIDELFDRLDNEETVNWIANKIDKAEDGNGEED